MRLSLTAPDGSPIVAQVGHDVELPLVPLATGCGRPGRRPPRSSLPATDITAEDLEEMFDEG